MSDQTILQTPPSNLDEGELSDALHVAPPSRRSLRVTRVLAALLLVAVGATGATWWAHRSGSTGAGAERPSFATGGALPSGFPSGFPGGAPGAGAGTEATTGGTGATTGTGAASAATTGEVVLVDGAKVYVKTSTGAVVTIVTDAATKVSRSTPSTVSQLAKGDTVTVTGSTTSTGVTATAITAS